MLCSIFFFQINILQPWIEQRGAGGLESAMWMFSIAFAGIFLFLFILMIFYYVFLVRRFFYNMPDNKHSFDQRSHLIGSSFLGPV